jgi:ubiquinone/menaquinone biosynthesis C-methylase UbiE
MSATHNYIKKVINNKFGSEDISIVDYGCGSGDLLNFININQIKSYVGYEVSNACINSAKNTFKNNKLKFKKIKKNHIPSIGQDNSIDLIVLVGVLQYMTDIEISNFLIEAKRVLVKNGIIIASCATDRWVYKIFNIYRLFIPNFYINRTKLVLKLENAGFKIELEKEKGLIIAPLFSNIFSLFFDALDRLFFNSKGTLGPIGKKSRKLIKPFISKEFSLPIDFGYTLFISASIIK